MKKNFPVMTLALAALMMTSCVSKKTYQALQHENAELRQNSQNTEVQLAQCNTSQKSLQDRLADAQKRNAELQRAYKDLQGSLDKSLQQNSQGNVNISKLVDEINASNRFIKQLISEKQEVDVQVLKGVVYISLADNMLYKSGSYEINERAGETLSKIAKIIKDYSSYDVLIEGNTDPVPISRPNIRNNWDLSCLRASSVVQALQNDYGVDPKRLTAAGRGEYNPVTTNDTEVGKQRNRRTQIIITPKLDQFMDLIDKAPETEQR